MRRLRNTPTPQPMSLARLLLQASFAILVGAILCPAQSWSMTDLWTQQQKMVASDGAANDRFGTSVALSGDDSTMLIGAYYATVGGNTAQGKAYVFVKSGTTWIQQQELTSSDGAASDRFGTSVALSSDGSIMLIGAPAATVGGNGAQGKAYVFVKSGTTWIQQQELTSSDGGTSDYFGNSVALSSDGSTMLIGAPGATVGGNATQGKAYVFVKSGTTWIQQQELTSSDGGTSDYFGNSVALSSDGSTMLIGAPGATVGSNSLQGKAYVFVKSGTTWIQQQELTSSDGAAGDNFGNSVALSSDGSTMLIGAPGATVGSN